MPILREQGSGHIIQVSSIGGVQWPLDTIREEYARRIATWEEWEPLSVRAHGQSQLTIQEN